MSIVGPRHCLLNQHELIQQRQQRGVFSARPGIKDLGQVNDIDMSTPRKLARYDALMIKRMDIKLYAQCIIWKGAGRGQGYRVKVTDSQTLRSHRNLPTTDPNLIYQPYLEYLSGNPQTNYQPASSCPSGKAPYSIMTEEKAVA